MLTQDAQSVSGSVEDLIFQLSLSPVLTLAALHVCVLMQVTWALGWALICAPFLFRWSLGLYVRAYPVQRASILGGSTLAGRDFIVRVFGHHHTGLLHAVLHCLHSEGLDVVEARVEATKHQLTDEARAQEH